MPQPARHSDGNGIVSLAGMRWAHTARSRKSARCKSPSKYCARRAQGPRPTARCSNSCRRLPAMAKKSRASLPKLGDSNCAAIVTSWAAASCSPSKSPRALSASHSPSAASAIAKLRPSRLAKARPARAISTASPWPVIMLASQRKASTAKRNSLPSTSVEETSAVPAVRSCKRARCTSLQ